MTLLPTNLAEMWEEGEVARKRQELAGRGMGRRVRTRGMPGFTVFFVAIVLAFNAGLTFYYHHRALEAQSKGAGAAPARNAELKARADAVQAAASLRDSVPIETVTSRNVSVVSWDALSQILLDVYASFLGSELKATMHKALVELGPDPKALKSARSGDACYKGTSTGDLPWWMAQHGMALHLPETRQCASHSLLWRVTHSGLRLVGSGGQDPLKSLRACDEGPGDTLATACLTNERLYECSSTRDEPSAADSARIADGGSAAPLACLDNSIARRWCPRRDTSSMCGGVPVFAAMIAAGAISVVTFGGSASGRSAVAVDASSRVVVRASALDSLRRNISSDVAELGAVVAGLYSAVLQRGLDDSGRHTYVNNLVLGRMSAMQIARALRDSPEFRQRFPAPPSILLRVPWKSHHLNARTALLRALAVLVALHPRCRGPGGQAAEAEASKILDGSRVAPPLLCEGARGVPLELYQRLLTMHVEQWADSSGQGVGMLADPVGVAKLAVDTRVLNAATMVDEAYRTHLGRWAGRRDISDRLPGVISGAITPAALASELDASGERRTLVSDTAPATASEDALAATSRLLVRLLRQHCPPARPACAVDPGTPIREMQHLWNVHGPVLRRRRAHEGEQASTPRSGSVEESVEGVADFAEVRKTLTGFVPIAMYVYNRPHYLRQVLSSLRAARGVDGVLLVVSTDACIETMVHEVMRATEFVAGVRLLFHPYPPRLFGPVGGRGGDGVLVVKSHWWFLVHQLWEALPDLRGYDGEVLFLEEDHQPTPDVLETLRALVRIKNGGLVAKGLGRGAEEESGGGGRGSGGCEGCWGVYLKFGCMEEDKESDIHKACRVKWFVNTGVAFNRSIYTQMAKSDFESFRDGWDWSIYHLIQTQQLLPCQAQEPRCIPHMVAPAVSRIGNIGTEGVTVHTGDQDSLAQLHYGTVGSDIYSPEKGFSSRSIALSPYFAHGGPTDEGLYFGFEEKHLQW